MTYYGDKIKMEPLSFLQFQITAELDSKKPEAMPDKWPVKVVYFDPVEAKELELNAQIEYRKT